MLLPMFEMVLYRRFRRHLLLGYKAGSPSVHGKLNVYKDDGGDSRELQLESRDGVDVKFLGAHGLLPLSLD